MTEHCHNYAQSQEKSLGGPAAWQAKSGTCVQQREPDFAIVGQQDPAPALPSAIPRAPPKFRTCSVCSLITLSLDLVIFLHACVDNTEPISQDVNHEKKDTY